MSVTFAKASLALWKSRAEYRRKKWQRYHDQNASIELRHKWYKLWQDAVVKVQQRTAELEAAKKAATPQGVSTLGTEAIAAFEGGQGSDGKFHPYRDSVGVWTIGYGHTENVSGSSKPLSRAEAETLLKHDLNVKYAPAVVKALKRFNYAVTQRQFDALVSFCYNLGPGYFVPGRSIGDALATHNPSKVADAILLYDKAGGRALPGLTRRRRWEAALFSGSGTYKVN